MKLKNSKKIYYRSKKVLSGPSTFSKGVDQFAYGISPYAISHAKGAYTWDVDNNKYLDTVMSLGAVLIGHNHKEINESIFNQLKKGTIFSLASSLETEVAELLTERIPSAEMVRFGKNGNDVTSAAVRLARHYTNKDHILFCGYHGWQDWYICKTSMNGGIPKIVSKYSHRFNYNDIDSLTKLFEKFKNKVACVIMEPISKEKPICQKICSFCKLSNKNKCRGFLNQVKKITHKNNAILIFDEVVSGFRFSRGGYQSISKVTPDLSCFSKGMANGMPISVLVGKKEFMKKSNEIFYSLTYGGEALSMAATKTVLNYIDKHNVTKHIEIVGKILIKKVNDLIKSYEMENVMEIKGFPQKSFIIFKNYYDYTAEDFRTFWIQQLTKYKILTLGTHLLSFSHKEKEINLLLESYEKVLSDFKKAFKNNNFNRMLQCPTSKSGARDL